ncbi:MAG: ABC transporter ATP-binding protein [Planctomycetota bacterium]
MIQWDSVSKRYGETDAPAVDGVSLSVERGELLAMVGESGSGKTTLLKMVNRLVEPDTGTGGTGGVVRVDGKDLSEGSAEALRRGMGYVIQSVGLLPHWTVAENVAAVPGLLGWDRKRVDRRVGEVLKMVGLEASLRERLPGELSGGQRQRVGVARALAGEPGILLMDEPFGAVDPINRGALRERVRGLHRELGLTSVLVTHDMGEALLMADRLAVMKGGKVLRVGTPAEVVREPGDPYVAALVGAPEREARRLSGLWASVASEGATKGGTS